MSWRPSDWEEIKAQALHGSNTDSDYSYRLADKSIEMGFNLCLFALRRAGSANPPGQVAGRWVFIKDDEEEK